MSNFPTDPSATGLASTGNTNPTTNPFASDAPPMHHMHKSSDVLPGARTSTSTSNTSSGVGHRSSTGIGSDGHGQQDYSTDVTQDPRTWQDRNHQQFGAGTDTRHVMAGGQHGTADTDDDAHDVRAADRARGDLDHSAVTEDRPLGVQPTEKGGVAMGGNEDLPERRAGAMDKLVGKAQKVTGKMTHNEALHEKGELRESGGKAAAQGQARAPHD